MPEPDKITSWPPKAKPPQVNREQLRRMTPEAIEQAREAGALEDLMTGKEPEAAP